MVNGEKGYEVLGIGYQVSGVRRVVFKNVGAALRGRLKVICRVRTSLRAPMSIATLFFLVRSKAERTLRPLMVYSEQINLQCLSVVEGHTRRESLVKFQHCRATVRVRMPGCNLKMLTDPFAYQGVSVYCVGDPIHLLLIPKGLSNLF